MIKDQFPVGTLLSSDCWSILVLAWSDDGKRATVLFEDGEIHNRGDLTIKALAARHNVIILLPAEQQP